LKDYW